MCVLEPTGDMLYFEVIKLFNCVSIFWNGIISSLKRFLKGIYGALCLWLILVLDVLFHGAQTAGFFQQGRKVCPCGAASSLCPLHHFTWKFLTPLSTVLWIWNQAAPAFRGPISFFFLPFLILHIFSSFTIWKWSSPSVKHLPLYPLNSNENDPKQKTSGPDKVPGTNLEGGMWFSRA